MKTYVPSAKKFALALFVAVLGATVPASATPPREALPSIVRGEEGGRMDELLRRAAAFGFAGQVVVERQGEVVLHGAYGIADRSAGRAMTTTTQVGIASLSKQLTAAAILALAEEGRLELEDPLGRFLPDLGPDKRPLTLHQLLSHTSGLPGGDVAGDDFVIESRAQLVERIDDAPLSGMPGERWRYSNAGYNLLAAVVEAVTGGPYEAHVLDRIFRPAGMEHSGFWHHPRPEPDEVAHAYRAWMDQGTPASWSRNWRTYGSGDVLSTAADLYRWEVALRSGTVLSAEWVALLRTPHAPIGETGDSYGYGWFLHPEDDGTLVVEHGGDWLGGYNAFHYVDPRRGVVLILTANVSDASGMWLRQALQKDLIDIASGEPVDLPPAVAADVAVDHDFLGSYRIGGRPGTFHLFHDGAHVWLAARGQEAASFLNGVTGEAASGLEVAARRSGRLLAGLLAGRTDAHAEALGEEGLPHLEDYERDWAGVVERFGELDSYEILGASPARGAAEVHARLSLAGGETSLSLLWADGGRGRLRGTLVRARRGEPMPFPAAYPVAVGSDGSLVAYDVFRKLGVKLTVSGDAGARRLVIESLESGLGGIEAWGASALVPAADGWQVREEQ